MLWKQALLFQLTARHWCWTFLIAAVQFLRSCSYGVQFLRSLAASPTLKKKKKKDLPILVKHVSSKFLQLKWFICILSSASTFHGALGFYFSSTEQWQVASKALLRQGDAAALWLPRGRPEPASACTSQGLWGLCPLSNEALHPYPLCITPTVHIV